MKPTLTIIGCGTVGSTLGFLWHKKDCFKIQSLYSRTQASAETAQEFIGAGSIPGNLSGIKKLSGTADSNIYLISTSDDQIEIAAQGLAKTNVIREGDIVFHCSGALSSDVLLPLKDQGASIASVHPIKSFTEAKSSSESFSGTYCTVEGDEKALRLLCPAFSQIGADTIAVSKDHKALYHASTTLICNYLCALMDVGFSCLEKSGLNKELARKAVEPLATETLKNIFDTGTTGALTGPIARGDSQTLNNQMNAIESFSDEYSELFKELSKQALVIASRKTSPEKLAGIRALLFDNKN